MSVKKTLIANAAEKAGVTKKQAEIIVNEFLAGVKEKAVEAPVKLAGFGTFKTVEKAERKFYSKLAGKEVVVPAKKVLVFKQSK